MAAAPRCFAKPKLSAAVKSIAVFPAIMFARSGLLIPLWLLATFAQQVPTLRTQSNVVIVPTLVRSADGSVLYGLKAEDFVIEDDAVSQTVHLDEAVETEPISIVIAIQTGRRAQREFPRMRGLHALLNPIFDQADARVALIEFDKHINLVSDFTSNPAPINAAIEELRPGDSGAAILDVVSYSAKLLNQEAEGRRKLLLLVSETRDHGSHLATIDDVVKVVGISNTIVHVLAFSPSLSQLLDTERGSNSDEWGGVDLLAPLVMARHAMKKNTAKAVARLTGGEYDVFASRNAFEEQMIDFTNRMHSRYMLSFEPRRPHPGLHRIRVRLKEPRGNASVISRATYWAAEDGIQREQ
jgi:VWFA-related protein